jgi:hypothetical protein
MQLTFYSPVEHFRAALYNVDVPFNTYIRLSHLSFVALNYLNVHVSRGSHIWLHKKVLLLDRRQKVEYDFGCNERPWEIDAFWI